MAAFNLPEEEIIDANIYIVCEIGWEYNDSFFYRPESEGGHPVNSFTRKALAEEYRKTKDCEWFIQELSGGRYRNPAYHIQEDIRTDDILELCAEVDGLEYKRGLFVCEDPKRLKYDQIHPLMEELELSRYEIVSVRLTA